MRMLLMLCCLSCSLYSGTHYDQAQSAVTKGDISALGSIVNESTCQPLTNEELSQLLIQAQTVQTAAQKELKDHYKKPSLIPFLGISAVVGTAFVIKLFKPSRLLPSDQQKTDRTLLENIGTAMSFDRSKDFFIDLFSPELHNAEDLKKIKTEAGKRTGGALTLIASSVGAWKLYDLYLQKKNKLYFDQKKDYSSTSG